MRLLLDTHAFLWWNGDDAALGPKARAAIADADNVVLVSAASAWEISMKRASGRLDAPGDIADWIQQNGFVPLTIEISHAMHAPELPKHHKDPFDRMLVAQAVIEGYTLVTSDEEIAKYEVEILDASE
jgi:PIN domain nuclease of toxin-antitoxin system